MLLRLLQTATCLVAAGLLAACATGGPHHAIETGNAFLWQASPPPGEGGALVVLGSIHANDTPIELGVSVEPHWRESETLVVELDATSLDARETAEVLFARGRLAEGTLPDHVSPETWAALRDFCLQRDIPVAIYLPAKPWFAALSVEEVMLREAGLDPENGVEEQLVRRAAREGRPIESLETLDEQFGAFDGLDLAVQEQHLSDALAQVDGGAVQEFASLWRRGDRAGLAHAVFSDERPEMAPLYDAIFRQRNHRMAERLLRLARDGRTRFVVVGAAHTVGPDSLPSLLARRGWTVSPDPESP